MLYIENLLSRCEHTVDELEYYYGQHTTQHTAVMSQRETSQECSALRSDLINDKQRLDREVQTLQKELSELRIHNQEVLDAAGTDSMNQHYLATLRKYEAVKEQHDSLKKRYDDLIASHSSAVNKASKNIVICLYFFFFYYFWFPYITYVCSQCV